MVDNKLNDNELEMITGGVYDTITDEMRQLMDRLVEQANYELYAKYPELIPGEPMPAKCIDYWNQSFQYYYSALTEEEKRMVHAYLELIQPE